jgi:UDP-N-acetylmuramoyl-L-alanyl-D-glutamate--2,6-diaminopimelate ligase
MLLSTLLKQFDPSLPVPHDVEIRRICEDSRLVQPGDLFIARPGGKSDGLSFLADAARRGAVAAVATQAPADAPLPVIAVTDPARAGSVLANAFRNHPSRSIKVLAVTGTNGKTTTAYLVRHLLARAGHKCGMIGTVEIDDGRVQTEAAMTTPGSIEVADLLGAMRDNGCKACAIETSSHALDQQRVAGVSFAGAGFTNLTQDHLDYHQTMEAYGQAKARLFTGLDETAVAAVNIDSEWSARMIENCSAKVIRFGLGKGADYRARDVAITAHGTHFILHTPDGRAEVSMPMIGRHNIENALCAASLVGEVMGLTVHQIAAGLRDAVGAPGRLQPVKAGQPFACFVDYAHTPDGLINVLNALRPLTKGRLRVLFGCGGDRDRTKRPRMAAACEELADEIYVTSDNPRTEQPRAIIADIVAGFRSTSRVRVEPDRRTAINLILSDADPSDVVLIAGKGHENYQILGQTKHHFDDVEEAIKAIESSAAA